MTVPRPKAVLDAAAAALFFFCTIFAVAPPGASVIDVVTSVSITFVGLATALIWYMPRLYALTKPPEVVGGEKNWWVFVGCVAGVMALFVAIAAWMVSSDPTKWGKIGSLFMWAIPVVLFVVLRSWDLRHSCPPISEFAGLALLACFIICLVLLAPHVPAVEFAAGPLIFVFATISIVSRNWHRRYPAEGSFRTGIRYVLAASAGLLAGIAIFSASPPDVFAHRLTMKDVTWTQIAVEIAAALVVWLALWLLWPPKRSTA